MENPRSQRDLRGDRCRDIESIIHRLLSNHEEYFNDGYLNSEGLKLIQLAVRIAAYDCKKYLYYVKKARKHRSLGEVLKILDVFENN